MSSSFTGRRAPWGAGRAGVGVPVGGRWRAWGAGLDEWDVLIAWCALGRLYRA